jgi:hypothetical protein
MGELWMAGGIETATICNCIHKLLDNAHDFSMECFCALIETVGEELEKNNEDLSEYFSIIEDMHKSKNGLSNKVKQNLQNLIKFRRQKWTRGKCRDQ